MILNWNKKTELDPFRYVGDEEFAMNMRDCVAYYYSIMCKGKSHYNRSSNIIGARKGGKVKKNERKPITILSTTAGVKKE